MTTIQFDLDDNVAAQMLTFVKNKTGNQSITLNEYLSTYIKTKVKQIRLRELDSSQFDTLIDTTGL